MTKHSAKTFSLAEKLLGRSGELTTQVFIARDSALAQRLFLEMGELEERRQALEEQKESGAVEPTSITDAPLSEQLKELDEQIKQLEAKLGEDGFIFTLRALSRVEIDDITRNARREFQSALSNPRTKEEATLNVARLATTRMIVAAIMSIEETATGEVYTSVSEDFEADMQAFLNAAQWEVLEEGLQEVHNMASALAKAMADPSFRRNDALRGAESPASE